MVCSTVRKPLLSINSEITESTVRDDDAVSDSVFDSSNHESNQPRRLNRTAVSEDSVIDSDTLASPRETGCISETSEDDEDCDETLTASVHRMEKKARKMDRVLRSAACLPETSGESGNIHSDSRDEEDEGSESHSDVEMMNISDDDDDRSMHAEGVVLSSQDVSPTVV
ncbi:unnamed protein product [Notodromas monacha]|uniref:Uncharacterized protein n=1 Tax=Notodromas monacha TaxID=399045 RepID=A0A7R9C0P7_9CRUS|nr:unnamed protein product [Notodromas monacha]CAG0924758.1 unnamed protein product [Notodromas monacha]